MSGWGDDHPVIYVTGCNITMDNLGLLLWHGSILLHETEVETLYTFFYKNPFMRTSNIMQKVLKIFLNVSILNFSSLVRPFVRPLVRHVFYHDFKRE